MTTMIPYIIMRYDPDDDMNSKKISLLIWALHYAELIVGEYFVRVPKSVLTHLHV